MAPVVISRGRASRRRRLLLQVLLGASAALALGVAGRVVAFHSFELTNLVWNLTLAWIPLYGGMTVWDGTRKQNAGVRAPAFAFL